MGLLQVLQPPLVVQMLRGLRRQALAAEAPGMILWRLCTPDLSNPFFSRPSLGAALAAIVVRQAPFRRLRVSAVAAG